MPRSRSAAGTATAGRRKAKIPGEEYLTRREGSPVWHYDFSIDSRRFRESCGTESKVDAAALALSRWQDAWNEVKLNQRRKPEMTLNDAFVRYYEEVCKGTPYGERSQKYNMALLLDALGKNTLLSQLDDERISRLVRYFKTRPPKSSGFKEGVSNATVNRYITTLSVICKRADDVWGVVVGPWKKALHWQDEPKGRETFLDHGQARALLNGLCGHAQPIVLLDLMTGLRKGNVIGLRWDNISMDLGRAVMVQKGGRRLAVSLVPEALALLERVQPDPALRRGPVWVFGNPNTPCSCSHCRPKRNHGQPIKSIKRAFMTAARNAGLRDEDATRLRFHDLRHTFASWVLAETGDLKLVQDALQHADIATTARYSHLMPGRKEAAIAGAVSGLFGVPAVDPKERKAG